jgi:hexosaminidase
MKISYHLSVVFIILPLIIFCNNTTEDISVADYILRWEVGTNYLENNRFRSQMVLINQSDNILQNDWTLYFNFMRLVDTESLPSHVRLTHINGDFYKLCPTKEFEPLEPGDEVRFSFDAYGSAIKKIDAPDGAYVELAGERIVPVRVVIEPFERDEQLNRHPDDAVPVPTPEVVYEQNSQRSKLAPGRVGKIVPSPVEINEGEGSFTITDETSIYYQGRLEREARFMSRALAQHLGIQPRTIEREVSTENNIIQLKLGEIEVGGTVKREGDEAYLLQITSEGIIIKGSDDAGVFYGIQSLRALFSPDAWQSLGSSITINAVTLNDAPGFKYRGLHLDVSRNFQSVETVKRLLDVMAYYKLNKFHFHLTDDEGWRLEINAFPELTEVGGRRGHTHDERDRLVPSFGSGPEPDKHNGSGWYTQEEYKDILRYATERHIEVIPEIDVPGHARAALVGMKARYERLIEENNFDEANRFRIHDPDDESEYRSVQRWYKNVVNVCQESTYRFLGVIFDEIIEMHEAAGAPISSIHIGGDEVPEGVWENSPVCSLFISKSDEVDSVDELMNYFFARIDASLSERKLVMSAWEEFSLIRDPETWERIPNSLFAGRSISYVWSNVWGAGTEGFSYMLANAGYDIILSHASNFYFNLAYNKHPEESGQYWAGFVDTRDPFSFIPFNLYKSGIKDFMGKPIPEDAYDDLDQPTESGKNNILGLQGHLWGATFSTYNRVEYMALPRIISLAERAWSPNQEWMNIQDRTERLEALDIAWNEFANRLGQRELPRLDRMNGGYAYRIPSPGAIREDNTVEANVAYPGLDIRYTTDGSEPTVDSPRYSEPVTVDENVTVKLRTFDTRGRGSRVVTME